MSDHQQQEYYDMRLLVLPLINMVVRPELGLFFSDYTSSTHDLLKALMLFSVLLCFISTSIQVGNLNGDGPFIRPQFGYPSPALASALLFSLLCPTSVFLYAYPLIIVTSLLPPFSRVLRSFLLRLRNAFSTFIAPLPLPAEEDSDSLLGRSKGCHQYTLMSLRHQYHHTGSSVSMLAALGSWPKENCQDLPMLGTGPLYPGVLGQMLQHNMRVRGGEGSLLKSCRFG
ncbi:hypothetical protein Cgig2_019430 [Carnegiea gigantea]|uniref:Uncharacterized protein n=1 Tax=Carnegiea gigantea TaxID=171969 RepID=A0A9Q1QMY4_9CARY|nr:hypothetical protein Cgig2_019430 [Carnegiea gigantea]